MNFKKAFTLIELLVVIAVIGILSGLIVVSMSGTTQKATIAKAQVFSNSLRNALMLNLIAEWKLDENTGTSTVDNWKSVAGTLNNSPVWKNGTDCIYGSCLQMGLTSYVNATGVTLIEDYSIEGWIKMDTSAGGASRIFVSFGSTVGTYPMFMPVYGTSKRPLIYLLAGTYRYGITDCADGKWHHWYFSVYSSNPADITKSKIFVDGKEDTYPNDSVGAISTVPTGNFFIGSSSNSTNSTVDNIRIYDTIIPTSMIREHYFAGLNQLLIKGSISKEEYFSRISDYAKK